MIESVIPKNRMQERTEKGQSLVEFAVSLVLLLLLLVGIVDISRAVYTYLALRDAAEEGAIFGSMYPDQTDVLRTRVIESSSLVNGMGLSSDENVDIVVTFNNYGNPIPCVGSLIEVWVEYPSFELTMPFIGAVVGKQTIPISAKVSATVLYPDCTP